MRVLLFFLLLLLATLTAQAQTALQGKVKDVSGQPVPGANVYLKGLYDGASTDEAGTFRFTTKEMGKQILVVSFLGYSTLEKEVDLNKPLAPFSLLLKPDYRQLQAVHISAGAFEASDEKRGALLNSRDIVTTAGATADIMGAINTLPGTQKVGEEGKLFVRGGDSYETRTFIDGLPVANPYNASVPDVPARGRFSPFLFSGMAFSSGGYSAAYGQALSSALPLESQGLAEESQTGVSLMIVGASLSRTKRWENTSLSASFQYTNLKPYMNLVTQQQNWRHMPESKAASLVFRQKTYKTGLLKVYGTYSGSHLGVNQQNLDSPQAPVPVDLRNRNLLVNTTHEDVFQEKWTLQTGLTFAYTQDAITAGAARVTSASNTWNGKVVLIRDLGHAVTLRTGLEAQLTSFSQRYVAEPATEPRRGEVDDQNLAAFVEADVYLGQKLVARPGLRVERSSFLNQHALSPRLALAYQVHRNGQVSFAYGHFYQTPENDYLKYHQSLTFERATHYILNYQHTADKKTFRVEGYYKRYQDLVRYNAPRLLEATQLNSTGYGFARGIEFFWRDQKSLKRGDYWTSYSLLDTKRLYRGFPEAARPSFASTHNLSLVYKQMFNPIKTYVGTTFSYTSGRPYHNPNLDGFQQSRTKNFLDLSLNASFLTNIKGHSTILHASCSNLLGFKNVFGYRYASSPDASGAFAVQPIVPGAKRFALLALLISINDTKN